MTLTFTASRTPPGHSTSLTCLASVSYWISSIYNKLFPSYLRVDIQLPHCRMAKKSQKHGEHDETYVTSHKKPFAPSVWGIGRPANILSTFSGTDV